MEKEMKKIAFIAAVCALVGTPALADIYTVGSTSEVTYTGVTGGTIYISGSWYTGSVAAGSYNLVVDSVSMQSFCIDLQDTSTTAKQTYLVNALKDAPDPTYGPMGPTKATGLAELLHENWVPGMTAADLLSLQVAVWEVVTDYDGTAGSLDLTNGNFMASDTGAATYLLDIDGGYAPTWLFVGLTSPYKVGDPAYQDYVVRVPLPGAVLLGGLGLVAAGRKLRKLA